MREVRSAIQDMSARRDAALKRERRRRRHLEHRLAWTESHWSADRTALDLYERLAGYRKKEPGEHHA